MSKFSKNQGFRGSLADESVFSTKTLPRNGFADLYRYVVLGVDFDASFLTNWKIKNNKFIKVRIIFYFWGFGVLG